MAEDVDPEQERLDAIDKQIQGIQGFDYNRIKDFQGIRDISKGFGVDASDWDKQQNDFAAGLRGRGENDVDFKANRVASEQYGEEGLRNMLAGRLTGKVGDLNKERTGLMESRVDRKIASVKQREQDLTSNLMNQKVQMNQAIDNQLNQILGETGINAGVMRQQAGAAVADKGLGRSSFAANAVGGITAQEQQDKANARLNAANAKSSVERGVNATTEGIAKQREKLAANRDLSQLKSFDQVGFDIDTNSLKTNFETEMAKMDMDAQHSGFLGQLAGGLLGGVAKIFSGGLL